MCGDFGVKPRGILYQSTYVTCTRVHPMSAQNRNHLRPRANFTHIIQLLPCHWFIHCGSETAPENMVKWVILIRKNIIFPKCTRSLLLTIIQLCACLLKQTVDMFLHLYRIAPTITTETWTFLWSLYTQIGSWGQHGAHLGPVGPRWAQCWSHELC